LEFEDGTVATIYDWKEYQTPMGLYHWHIGGRNNLAVHRVISTFKETANAKLV
jgi:DNA-binding ferritin-like protein